MFCESWQDEVLYGGAAGGGKTDCLIMEATRYVNFPDYHGLVARRTFPMLQEIIDRTRQYYPLLGGEYKAGEHRWYFPSGARISLGHCQHDGDEYGYQGKEFQFLGFDEAGQFLPKMLMYLFSRCRSTNPNIPKRIRYASNPGGPAHQFLKERFRIAQYPQGNATFEDTVDVNIGPGVNIRETMARVFIPGRLIDNPSLLTNDPGYVARLMQLPEIERMRLLQGIWDTFEGQVFSELNWEVHGCEPFEVPPEWPRYRSFDWGYSSPYAVLWWAVDYDGRIYLYRELYGANKNDERRTWVGMKHTAAEVARRIKEIEREQDDRTVRVGPADPAIWNKRRDMKTGIVGRSVADEMSDDGIQWIPADNDRLLGKHQLHSRLRVDEKGDPHMFVFRNCEHFWRTLPELRENPRNPEDIDDKDAEDHIYDCTRYFLMFHPMRAQYAKKDDIGSFQSERRKYLRAKEFAVRHGVSMDRAYDRVR